MPWPNFMALGTIIFAIWIILRWISVQLQTDRRTDRQAMYMSPTCISTGGFKSREILYNMFQLNKEIKITGNTMPDFIRIKSFARYDTANFSINNWYQFKPRVALFVEQGWSIVPSIHSQTALTSSGRWNLIVHCKHKYRIVQSKLDRKQQIKSMCHIYNL